MAYDYLSFKDGGGFWWVNLIIFFFCGCHSYYSLIILFEMKESHKSENKFSFKQKKNPRSLIINIIFLLCYKWQKKKTRTHIGWSE